MLKRILLPLLFIFISISLAAQPKIAVLDATTGQGVSPNASAIVADTINEQFVKAPQFTAIDRAYISKIQEEKKFQLSGDVNEADIKEIGSTFGADYLCVANVSLLGSTYTVSARLIEVSTAEVTSQESHYAKGEIDILFEIAQIVGAKLVGADISAFIHSEPVAEPEPEPEPAVEPEPETRVEPEPRYEPVPEPRREKPKKEVKGHFLASWMFPAYSGAEDSVTGGYSFYTMDEFLNDIDDDYDASNTHTGIDVHLLQPVAGFVYMSVGFTYTQQVVEFDDSDGDLFQYETFSTYEPYLGLGVIVAPTSFMNVYGGVLGGINIFVLGSDYGGYADGALWEDEGEAAVGATLGFELGSTFYWGPFGLDIRYKFTRSGNMTGDLIFTEDYEDTSFGTHGLMLGIGFVF